MTHVRTSDRKGRARGGRGIKTLDLIFCVHEMVEIDTKSAHYIIHGSNNMSSVLDAGARNPPPATI